MVLRGKKPDTLWVNKRVVKCPEEVARQLAIAVGSDVFMLKRIRYVDEDAVSLEESRVPAHLIHDVDAISVSLYDYFRSQQILPRRTRSRVSARMPDAEFQSHIKMDSAIPVLVIKQVALDQYQHPIEYSISYCRSDHTFCVRGVALRGGAIAAPMAHDPGRNGIPQRNRFPSSSRRPARQAYHRRDCPRRRSYRRPRSGKGRRDRSPAG